MIALQGTLESIYLASILQLLCNDKKSGLLRVWTKEDEVRIFFEQGTIVYTTGSQRSTRLGYLLRSEGLIPEEQLWFCLELAREKKVALGKVLIEQGLISAEKLQELNSRKVEQTLYSLFLWKKGEFEYMDKELNLEGHILTQVDTLEIILEASRRADEMALMMEKYPDVQMIFIATHPVESCAAADLDEEERLILGLLDGNHTIQDLVERSSLDSFSSYRCLDRLVDAGLAVLCNRQRPVYRESALNSPTIVQVYYDALMRVYRQLREKLGDMAQEVVVQSLQELEPRQRRLLSAFSLQVSAESNLQEMEKSLAQLPAQEEVPARLISAFEDLLVALLGNHKTELGENKNRALLKDIENRLSLFHNYRNNSSCGIEIISSEATPSVR
jgi:hypothetical protein